MLSKMRGITLYEPAEGDGELQEFTPTVRQLPCLHSHQEPALRALTPRPLVHDGVNVLPSAQVEVAHAEVRPL